MGDRLGVGVRLAVRRRGMVVATVIIGLACVLGLRGDASERGGGRALDHHLAVFNGRVVGSAFVIAEGFAVTNAHVVSGLRPGGRVELVASGSGQARGVGRLVAISSRMDLAVLAVPAGFAPHVAATDAPRIAGLAVIAAGIDAGGSQRGLPRFEVSGRVLNPRNDSTGFGPGLVARLPGVRPGFSGGPVFDRAGRLVGMIAAIRPARAAAASLPMAASGFAPTQRRAPAAEEALVLRASEMRAEVQRLLRTAGR
jgi:S1-C subfamily serine protease